MRRVRSLRRTLKKGGPLSGPAFAAGAVFLAPPRSSLAPLGVEFWGYELRAMYKQYRPRPKTPKDLRRAFGPEQVFRYPPSGAWNV